MIILKSESEIARIREAGRLVARVLRILVESVVPNKTSAVTLNFQAERLVLEAGAFPAFKGYRGYPTSLCVAVNHQVVHGIPSPGPLKEGDIVGLDIGIFYQGYCADSAITIGIGKISEDASRLLKVTEECLYKGIAAAKVGNRMGDVGFAIQRHAERNGFSLAQGLAGHGVGRAIHESPDVPNTGRAGKGVRLQHGMTIAIEPMVCIGSGATTALDDGWTVVTQDKGLSAHFEHTVAITRDGAEILTVE